MNNYEYQYLDHMNNLLTLAQKKNDRTGTGTQSIFGHQIRHDLRKGFPLLTTKKVFLKGVIHELLWFLNGDTNIKYLTDNGVHIWDGWATDKGELGPVYGKMWREWGDKKNSVDQISNLIKDLKTNPNSRRHIVSAWDVSKLPDPSISPKDNAKKGLQALPPCHTLFQLNCEEIPLQERKHYWKEKVGANSVSYSEEADEGTVHAFLDERQVPKYYLDLQLYQRSADWFLGVPFNVASYSLLLMMIAQVVDMIPRFFVHSFGDTHLYLNHLSQAKEQLSRGIQGLPEMSINKEVKDIFSFKYEDFELVNYQPHAAIKAEVSI